MHREVIIIIGQTGFGKSTWFQKYAALNIPRLFVFDPFKATPAEYIDANTLLARHDQGLFKSAANYSVGTFDLANMELFGAVSYLTGNCVFAIEECGVAFYKGERIPEWLSEIIFLGRHQAVGLVLLAQRAASIPIELRSQASRFITFRQTEDNDVSWCKQYVGKDRFAEIPLLPKFTCLDATSEGVSRYAILPPSQTKP